MLTEEEALAEVIRAHLPRDRYDEDGGAVSTYCTGCDWEGDYLADGEAGPFDDHLANAVLASAWLAAHDAAVRDQAAREAGAKALEDAASEWHDRQVMIHGGIEGYGRAKSVRWWLTLRAAALRAALPAETEEGEG